MKPEQTIFFESFCLDPVNECLWCGPQATFLPPKAFAALHYLVQHPGRLVTKKELLGAVWADTYVSDAALKVCIQRLRVALSDDPHAPRLIETVYKRGYRFIADVHLQDVSSLPPQQEPEENVLKPALEALPGVESSAVSLPPGSSRLTHLTHLGHLVGRTTTIARLNRWLKTAYQGERQAVFISGEAGIGKTSVVEAFLDSLSPHTEEDTEDAQHHPDLAEPYVARGQCVEHYGPGEAYLPVLEAIGRLCHTNGGTGLRSYLSQYAPTWLAQMPWLIDDVEGEGLRHRTQGATQERMLREMAELIEAVTAQTPLILVLEELQWSDSSTLDLLSVLAQRQEPARLFLIGTYRSEDVQSRDHPLSAIVHELGLHGHCQDLGLRPLTKKDVADYLGGRFPGNSFPAELARIVYQRTDGNPLFMVTLVDDFVAQGVLAHTGEQWQLQAAAEHIIDRVPQTVRQLVEKHIERLSPEEQQVLEAASVVGMECSAAAVAAGVEAEIIHIEEICERLARRGQFLRSGGVSEWPDGTLTTRYAFLHTVYQHVWYERVPVGKRVYLHQHIGDRIEHAYGERASEVAAELAVHFERGRAYQRAVTYLHQAAENATRRYAYREAIAHCHKGINLLKTLSQTPERASYEVRLQLSLGRVLQLTKGAAATEVERVYTRAQELCGSDTHQPQLLRVWQGLRRVKHERGELGAARALAEQCVHLAQEVDDTEALLWAHSALGETSFLMGELSAARFSLEQGLALPAVQDYPAIQASMLSWLAQVLSLLGYQDQAFRHSQAALSLAETHAHPYPLTIAHHFAAVLYMSCREWQAAQEHLATMMRLATRQGFAPWIAQGTILGGGLLAMQGQEAEGIAQIRRGLEAYHAIGAAVARPYSLALLAEAYGRAGRPDEGLAVLAEALAAAQQTQQYIHEARLYRLKGELLLAQDERDTQAEPEKHTERPACTNGKVMEAEQCFQQALVMIGNKGAKALELQTVMSLCRVWGRQGKKKAARRRLAAIYGWFTEGFDTSDLREAKALLDELV